MAGAFTESVEWQADYAGLDSEEMVRKMYRNILGREADPAGLEFWVNEIEVYPEALPWVLMAIADSEEMQFLTASS